MLDLEPDVPDDQFIERYASQTAATTGLIPEVLKRMSTL